MIKFLLILIPGIICMIMIRFKSKYRMQITAGFIVFVILMNLIYNARFISGLISLRTTVNQLIYQEEYADSLEYPDALINIIIDGKTVYMKEDYKTIPESEELGFNWMYGYFHYIAPSAYFEHYGSEVIHDEELNNIVIKKDEHPEFEDIGYANDMLRNVCLFHPDTTEIADYFSHYWYYREWVKGMHIYANLDGIKDADELVLIWQNVSENEETEDLYLMTKQYFDENIAKGSI